MEKGLGHKTVSAVFWGAGGTITQILLQIAAQITLARLLGPEQYGLFAIGAIVVSFSSFFADIGISYGLIQKSEITDKDIRFVFTWQLVLGSITAIAVALLSKPISDFFGDGRSTNVVQWLALICLFNALASPSLNILKRNLDFRRIKISQVSSYIVGYILVGIPLAVFDYQVWALVAAWLTQSALMTILLYLSVRHSIRPLLWHKDAHALSTYGLTVLATNLTNWMINNIDRVIVGRLFAVREIGLYTTPYNMLFNPTSSLIGVIQPVFFSATARIADQPKKIETAYRSLVGAVCLFILPIFVGVSAVADTFVLTLYGAAWHQSASILQPLALVMPLYIIWGLSTPMLWTGGHTSREFKSQLPLAVIWIAVSWGAAQISLTAVAWATLLLFSVRCIIIVGSVGRLLSYDLNALWRASQGGVVLSIIVAISIAFADELFRSVVHSPVLWLIADMITALVVIILMLLIFPKICSHDVAILLQRLTDRLPKKISRHIYPFLARVTPTAKGPKNDS